MGGYRRVDTTFLVVVDGEELGVFNATRGDATPVGAREFTRLEFNVNDVHSMVEAARRLYEMYREWIDAYRYARRVLERLGFRVHLGKAVAKTPRGRVTIYFSYPEAVIRTRSGEEWVRGESPRDLVEKVLARVAEILGVEKLPDVGEVKPLSFTHVKIVPIAGRVVDEFGNAVIGYFAPSGNIKSLVSSKTVTVDPERFEEAMATLLRLLNAGATIDEALDTISKMYNPGAKWLARKMGEARSAKSGTAVPA